MFKSLFGTKKPVFDPALGDPLGKVILSEARQGKINSLLKQVELLRTGEWDRRAFYIDLAGEYLINTDSMEMLTDTPLGNLIRGNMEINIAWRARGHGDAVTVTKNGWKLFFEHLNIARKYISRAAEQDLEDPTPFVFLQTVALGLQLGRKTEDAWFGEATRRDPTNQQAHTRHLIFLCKKWYGSHEDMYAFARATMKKASAGSTLSSILYLAFQEHYLFFKAFDNNIGGARALLLDQDVRRESIEAYQNSLQRRTSIERVSDYWPHNIAVWWFLNLNIPNVVRQETKKIGPHFTKYPWAFFYRDPGAGYQRALNI